MAHNLWLTKQFNIKSQVFQSIVSFMLEKDLVYSIQHFPNQNNLLQLPIPMMDVNDQVVTKIMWLIARVDKLSLTSWTIWYVLLKLILQSYDDEEIEAIISQSTDCEQSILLNCTVNPITGFRLEIFKISYP